MLGHFLKLAMVCNRLHDVGRTCAFASFQVILVADVHQSMMLSFGCFLPIVQPPFVVLKQTHTQAVALDFTYVKLRHWPCRAGGPVPDTHVEAAWLGGHLLRSSARW